MKFDFEIRNLGKVKHAKLKLAPFTVIAGTNSSGKSFISRALYSFFSTINKDHVTADTLSSVARARALVRSAFTATNNPSLAVEELFIQLSSFLEDLEIAIHNELGECTYLEQHARSILIEEHIANVERAFDYLLLEINDKKKYIKLQERINLAHRAIRNLRQSIKNPSKLLSEKIESGFKEALKENFQVPNLVDLKKIGTREEENISFNFGSLGDIYVNKEEIEFELTPAGIDEFQSLYNVVFIESPIYWKLRKPLSNVKNNAYLPSFLRRFHKDSNSLSGVPKYFYDLIELVEKT